MDHRWRVTSTYRPVTYESQTAREESKISQSNCRRATASHKPLLVSHSQITDDYHESIWIFYNTFIKYYFQKRYGFQMPLRIGGFYLKKESLRFDVY